MEVESDIVAKADAGLSRLTRALAQKWGYHSVEAMREDAMERFSLVKSGVLDKPCTRLLLVNVSRVALDLSFG